MTKKKKERRTTKRKVSAVESQQAREKRDEHAYTKKLKLSKRAAKVNLYSRVDAAIHKTMLESGYVNITDVADQLQRVHDVDTDGSPALGSRTSTLSALDIFLQIFDDSVLDLLLSSVNENRLSTVSNSDERVKSEIEKVNRRKRKKEFKKEETAKVRQNSRYRANYYKKFTKKDLLQFLSHWLFLLSSQATTLPLSIHALKERGKKRGIDYGISLLSLSLFANSEVRAPSSIK